jgi:DNA (cytosine-5)-methyltransferase 1
MGYRAIGSNTRRHRPTRHNRTNNQNNMVAITDLQNPKIGSLFSGYGGLDLGVMEVFGGSVVWHCEFDAAPSKILEKNFPGVPNFGDVTKVDWATVEPVDILTGGFPCQDVSLAGKRAGLKDGTRSGLWSEFANAISILKPRLVVIENVRGLLSAATNSDVEFCPWCMGETDSEYALRALGAVLGDLADLGFNARWEIVSASDAGAPHRRQRVFIIAYPDRG